MSLVLSRKVGQSICIGDEVTVTISRIDGDQVRVLIVAPKSISVDREEIRARKLADPLHLDK